MQNKIKHQFYQEGIHFFEIEKIKEVKPVYISFLRAYKLIRKKGWNLSEILSFKNNFNQYQLLQLQKLEQKQKILIPKMQVTTIFSERTKELCYVERKNTEKLNKLDSIHKEIMNIFSSNSNLIEFSV